MARIVFEVGEDRGLVYNIESTVVRIGRSSNNDLQIPDKRCSRQHAEIVRDSDGYSLRDLGAKNKVQINDVPVDKKRRLQSGDRIRIGDTVLVFEEGGEDERPGKLDDTSTSIQLVDDAGTEWGKLRGTVAAGRTVRPEPPLAEARGEAIDERRRHLEILYQVAASIRSTLELDPLLQQITDILMDVLKPDTVVVMLVDEKKGGLQTRVVRTQGGENEGIRISRSIVDQCIADRVSMLVSDAAQDVRFAASESIVAHKIRSAICSPLIHQDDVMGVIYIDTKSAVSPYQEAELELVTGIVNQAAVAIANARLHARLVIQNRLEREMEIARAIQMNLLPREAPAFKGFDIWGKSQPAKHVGGDYFDYIPRSENELGIAIADVSGKGVAAALLTASMRASLQILAGSPAAGVRPIMAQLNRTICRDASDEMFISAVFGIIDARRKEIAYSNAGHCYPLVFLPDGTHLPLDKGACFLGIDGSVEYDVATAPLPPGSTLLLYTDGVTDMLDRWEEMFGLERLFKHVQSRLNLAARDLCESVFDAIADHRGEADQFDDCTVVVVKSLP